MCWGRFFGRGGFTRPLGGHLHWDVPPRPSWERERQRTRTFSGGGERERKRERQTETKKAKSVRLKRSVILNREVTSVGVRHR